MDKPQPNNTNPDQVKKSKKKPKREYIYKRSIEEILASDDEFPDFDDDTPNIPAYLIDDKFDELSFPWLDNKEVKHFDTEIPYVSDDDTDKEDTKEICDNVESPPHGLKKSTGAIKKTQCRDICDDTPNIPAANLIDKKFDQLTFPWLDNKEVKHFDTEIPYVSDDDTDKKDTKEICDNVESPPHGLKKSTGAIKKTQCRDICDDTPNIPAANLIDEKFDQLTFPWLDNKEVKHFDTEIPYVSYYDTDKKDTKETCDNVESPPHGLKKSTGAIKKTQFRDEKEKKETCDNVESPPHGLKKSTGAIKKTQFRDEKKKKKKTRDNVESPPHGLKKSTSAIKKTQFRVNFDDIPEANLVNEKFDQLSIPWLDNERVRYFDTEIPYISYYDTYKKDTKETCDNVESQPHGLKKSTGAIKKTQCRVNFDDVPAAILVNEKFDQLSFPWLDNERVRYFDTEIPYVSYYDTDKNDTKETCDNVESPPHGLKKSTGAIKKTQFRVNFEDIPAANLVNEKFDQLSFPWLDNERVRYFDTEIPYVSYYDTDKNDTKETCDNVESPPHGLKKSTGAIKKTQCRAESVTANNRAQVEKDNIFFIKWVLGKSRKEDKMKKGIKNKTNMLYCFNLQTIQEKIEKKKKKIKNKANLLYCANVRKIQENVDNSKIMKDGIDVIKFQNMTIKEDDDLNKVKEPKTIKEDDDLNQVIEPKTIKEDDDLNKVKEPNTIKEDDDLNKVKEPKTIKEDDDLNKVKEPKTIKEDDDLNQVKEQKTIKEDDDINEVKEPKTIKEDDDLNQVKEPNDAAEKPQSSTEKHYRG